MSAGPGAVSPGAVTVRLRGLRDDLAPALRRVADVVLADPAGAASFSISQLAAAAGSSPSSVLRLAHQLGLDGYPELRLALARDAARGPSRAGTAGVDGDIAQGDDLASVVAKIVAADVRAVQDTAAALDVAVLEKVIGALAAARRVDLYGVGASGIVAADLQQKLTRIGRVASAFSDAHLGVTSAALLTSADAAIAISHTGATTDTLDALLVARRVGATTVAITNAPLSPLARAADHVLLTAAVETMFRSGATASRLAQLTVIDCLFVGLAQRTFEASQAALEATYDAVRHRPTAR